MGATKKLKEDEICPGGLSNYEQDALESKRATIIKKDVKPIIKKTTRKK